MVTISAIVSCRPLPTAPVNTLDRRLPASRMSHDSRAMPIPSFHSNVDSDEFIFYAEGNFFSRRGSGIERGSVSLHPAGHVHGPHPGSVDKAAERVGQRTEEIAVMLDTFRPLRPARRAESISQSDYVHSWTGRKP